MQDTPSRHVSSSNRMVVRYVAQLATTGQGWSAIYNAAELHPNTREFGWSLDEVILW